MTEKLPLANKYLRFIVVSLSLIGFVLIFSIIVGVRPNDYMSFIRSSTINWLHRETSLYDPNAPGFYFMPWSLLLFIPTVWFPPAIGQGMLNVLTLIGVLMAVRIFGDGVSWWLKFLACIPFSLFVLLITGNLDGIVLLGFCMSLWGIKSRQPFLLATGLWLATMKPINILPLLVFVFATTWRWSWKDKFKALSLLFISIIVSFPLFGLDWPLRYYSYLTTTPPLEFPIVTIWRIGNQFDIPIHFLLAMSAMILVVTAIEIKIYGFNFVTFSLATAAWIIITPYALIIHYVLLIPAFLITANHMKGVGVVAFLMTYLTLLRVPYGYGIIYVDMIYPLLLWISILYILHSHKNIPEYQLIQIAQQP
jgi:hypothetical protein